MKSTKKIISIVLSILMIMSVFTAVSVSAAETDKDYSSGGADDNGVFEYTYGGGDYTAEITKYIGTDENVEIPSDIDGYTVVKICDSAFRESAVKSVTVSDTVTTIGDNAFRACENLEAVTLGSSVESLGSKVFKECSALKTITLPESLTNLGDITFMDCTSLESIVIPQKVTEISTAVFSGCTSLKTVTIPASVTNIADSAFEDCTALERINYKGSQEDWEKIVVGSDNEALASAYIHYNYVDIGYDYEILEDGTAEITKCNREDTDLLIPSTIGGAEVTSLASELFYDNKTLKNVGIPNSVTKIGDGAFQGCESLEYVVIPAGVEEILGYTFSGCKSLNDVVFAGNITSIGAFAFSECYSLTYISIPESVTAIGKGAFSECSCLTSVVIPNGVKTIGMDAFNNCSKLESLSLPENLESVGTRAFIDCKLSYVTIPPSVQTIGDFAFGFQYDSIQSLEIQIPEFGIFGNEETAAQVYAEKYGFDFTDISNSGDNYSFDTLEDGTLRLTRIYSTDKAEVKVPKKINSAVVSEIDTGAFDGHDEITKIIIPASVIQINGGAFMGCKNLEEIEVDSGSLCFTVIDGVLYSKDGNILFAYPPKKSGTSFTVPETVTVIARGAFDECALLEDVTIPSNVETISRDAFYDCTNLANVNFSEGLQYIELYVFYNCPNLKTVTLPMSLMDIDGAAFGYVDDGMGGSKKVENFKIRGYSGYISQIYASANGITFEDIGEEVTTETEPENTEPESTEPETITFSFDEGTGVLTISGTGAIPEYPSLYDRPWNAFSDKAKKIVIEDGITEISDYAFQEFTEVEEVVISDTVTKIGRYAFEGCAKLKNVTLGNSVAEILSFAFFDTGLESIKIPASVTCIEVPAIGYKTVSESSADIIDGFKIIAPEGSYAQQYAENSSGFVFESDGTIAPTIPEPTETLPSPDPTSPELPTDPVVTSPTNPTVNPASTNTVKVNNPVKVTVKVKTVKAKKVKKKKVTVKPLTIKKAQGNVEVKKVKKGTTAKIYKKITVNKKTGAITFKKGNYKKKTYKIKIKIYVKGNSKYKAKTIYKTVKIKIK